jgi:predicted PurR-regulated permease PerM
VARASTEGPFPTEPVRAAGKERRAVRVVSPFGWSALRWVALAMAVGALLTLWPLWAPLVLAAWFALIARPVHARLSRWMGKKERGAAVATVLLLIIFLAPISVVLASLATDAVDLVDKLSKTRGARDALGMLLNGGNASADNPANLDLSTATGIAQRHGATALGTVTKIAGATTTAIIGIVVFIYGFYVFLVHGRRTYEWIEENAPLERRDISRLADAFNETGRGLIVGIGLTAALQGAVAAVGFLVIGLSHALVLGLLTAFSALIPSIGTGLVWLPLAAGLAIGGDWQRAIAVIAIGLVISVADNFVRPALSRYGKLQLPMYALFVAMLGGFMAFGAWGLVLGPLMVRMAVEGLRLLRERRPPARSATAS